MNIITLLTDFGCHDPYVGIMKGVILSIADASVVDITHDVAPQDLQEAAFLIEEYWRYFPEGTVHVAVVDPTVGSSRRPIVMVGGNHFFVGPDNGIFTLVMGETPEVYAIEDPRMMLPEVSSTFHGRDIFAPAAAHLVSGVQPRAFGGAVSNPVHLDDLLPARQGTLLKGKVRHLDHFGNAVSNIKLSTFMDFVGGHPFEIRINTMTFTALSNSYFEHTFTCLAGSSGYIEFGHFMGNFANALGIDKGEPVTVERLPVH